jgi:hypothetical protein
MNSERSQPPALASWLLRHLCSRKDREALTGDLYERFGEGQSERWFWRQVLIAILVGAVRGFSFRFFLILLMALNALVFFFGAILHSGVAIGPFHQPHIVPATVAEILCGLSLGWGVAALFKGPPSDGRVALTSNLVAAAGVGLGVGARVVRQQTWPTITLDHRVMLALICASLVILLLDRPDGSKDIRT